MAKNLTPKQQIALAALVGGATIPEAARQAGVTERTVDNWLKLSAFADAVSAASSATLETALRDLQASCGAAVAALVRIMNDTLTPPAQVISAARAVLDFGMKGRELIEMEERLAALEAEMSAQKESKR